MVTATSSACTGKRSKNVFFSPSECWSTFISIKWQMLRHWAMPFRASAKMISIHRRGICHLIWSFHLIPDQFGVGYWNGCLNWAAVLHTLSVWSYRLRIFSAFACTSWRFAIISNWWLIWFAWILKKFNPAEKSDENVWKCGSKYGKIFSKWLIFIPMWWSKSWVPREKLKFFKIKSCFFSFQHIWFGGNSKFNCDLFTFAREQCGIGVIDVYHGKCTLSVFNQEKFNEQFLFLFSFTISMLYLQSAADGIVTDVICVICALMWCTLFCYFGNLASDRLYSLGYASFSANWYDYPIKWQKFIVLMILRSQECAEFHGLGLISCTLEVLGKVRIFISVL